MRRNIDFTKYFMPDLNKARKRIASANIINDSFEVPLNMVNFGVNKFYHIRTYGCQSNIRDSETMRGICEVLGYKWTDDIYLADLVILNTCAVRENAEEKVFGEIGLLKKIKYHNPNFIFGIAGCMSQEEVVVKRILNTHAHIDFILGTHNIYRLPQVIEQAFFSKETVVEIFNKEGDVIENLPVIRNSSLKAWVNIMYGCDKFCTYCIVPYTRGKVRSRLKQDIIKEVQELVSNGYKDITLLGQNVNSYGIDFKEENYRFWNLLNDIAKLDVKRLRFTTSNPFDWDNKIIDVMANNSNIMPFVHLPIQSGDEEILLKMNRKMKIADYLSYIEYIRAKIPNVAISTDLIVGFPNESDQAFNNTLKLYEKVKFDNAYTFIYSKRDGTPAVNYDDSISLDVKKQRLAKLNELVKKYAKLNNEKYIGQELVVLVEGQSKTNPDYLTGYSPQQKVVNFKGTAKIGDFVSVKIDSASRFSLNGTQVE